MNVMCWGKFPVKGKCPNIATRFFISQIKDFGNAANRAVCDSCYKVYRFDHFVKHGSIVEVPQDEWQECPGQMLQERT